ncbi:MAG: HD domain-containing protein, partial [Planctomycetes bacterium]|nr:HD domain-containing protein [Planctomycetota bacterium]
GALVTLGRDGRCQIVLEDDEIAGTHCQIERRGKRWVLTSLDDGSSTRVNNERVATRTLYDGDQIELGGLRLRFLCEAAQPLTTTSGAFITPRTKALSEDDDNSARSLAIPAEELLPESRVLLSRRIDEMDRLSAMMSARAREDQTIDRLRKALDTIYSLSSKVLSEIEEEELYHTMLEAMMEALTPDRAHILIWDASEESASVVAMRRTRICPDDIPEGPSQDIVRTSIQDSVALLTADASSDPRFEQSDSVQRLGVHSMICVPIISGGHKLGAICVEEFSPLRRFQEYELELLAAVAQLAGLALERARMHEEMENLFYSCIRALVSAIETKDLYTHGHSERVAAIAVAIANEMNVDEKTLDDVRLGALLHDIGKIGVPEQILQKPSRLTDDEYEIIKSHPARGAEILSHIAGLKDVIAAVRWHHEKMNGAGYPDGLAGDEIPLAARIVSVADAFDAMTSNRAYRDNLSVEDTIREFEAGAGSQFDHDVALAMVKLLREGEVTPYASKITAALNLSSRSYRTRSAS